MSSFIGENMIDLSDIVNKKNTYRDLQILYSLLILSDLRYININLKW